jgi:hypothetical protein
VIVKWCGRQPVTSGAVKIVGSFSLANESAFKYKVEMVEVLWHVGVKLS